MSHHAFGDLLALIFIGGPLLIIAWYLFKRALALPTPIDYRSKCKRLRIGGPTPCYCCPGKCVGEPE